MKSFASLCLLAAAAGPSILAYRPLQQQEHQVVTDIDSLPSDFQPHPGHIYTLSHPELPSHKLEIKKHDGDWCDSVTSYSGTINAGHGKDIFFSFFESRHSPADDPVVLWLNGGPGCASTLGLFQELGPCTIVDPSHLNGTAKNPYSWNSRANLIFIEQPIGVSFSFGRHGQMTGTTEQAALDVQAFLSVFFGTFKRFQKNPFFMAGESYGGRYLPVFASTIHDLNPKNAKKDLPVINLRGVLIGNGITSSFKMQEAYYTYQCTSLEGIGEPLQSITNCVEMRKALPYCVEMMETECLRRHDRIGCGAAMDFCASRFSEPFMQLGLNPYDVSKKCTQDELADGLCYGEAMRNISAYLDLPEVRSYLGVSPRIGNFSTCSSKVAQAFADSQDETDMTWLYVAGLLERKIPVISYVGTYDWICNYIGNEAWLEALEWTGSKGYKSAEFRDWEVDGKVAGYTKTFNGLTFATVQGAGHMVPMDKPVEALALLNRWIDGGGDAL